MTTTTMDRRRWFERTSLDLRFWSLLAASLLIQIGGLLLSVEMRLRLPVGRALWEGYRAQTPGHYAVILVSVMLVHLASHYLQHHPLVRPFLGDAHPYRRFLVSVGISAAAMLILLPPNVSQLQVAYFVIGCAAVGLFTIALPFRIYFGRPNVNLLNDLILLWQNRWLFRIWLSYNVQARYSQRVLGVLWIALIPISTSLVLAIAFSQIMRVQLDVPFISFYLAGFVPYNLFAISVLNSTMSVIMRMPVITQIYFPREILVLLTMGEGLVDFVFTFSAMVVVNAVVGILPNLYYLLLPLLIVIIVATALGAMFIVSSLTVLVRDIPQLMHVAMQLFFYLTPVIYPVSIIPEQYRFLFILNPVAPLVQAFRDIIVFQRMPDPVSLYYPLVFAGTLLVFGYATFKSIEGEMADMI